MSSPKSILLIGGSRGIGLGIVKQAASLAIQPKILL